MAIVRLELKVPDGQAADVANELAARYLSGGPFVPAATSAVVDVRTDAEAARDADILRAAGYFLREA